MGSIPFTLYDFFAYLSAGALWLFGADYAFRLGWILGKEVRSAEAAFWLIAAYVIGHINAHWAAWLLEGQVVRRLGYPSRNLFEPAARRPFKHYRTPLPTETSGRILDKYQRLAGSRTPGEAMFLFCYHLVKERCPQAYTRLQTLINLYGFSRNVSFATLLIGAMLVAAALVRWQFHLVLLAGASLLASLSLFFRYLKFFRHYSVEVFTSFLNGVPDDGPS